MGGGKALMAWPLGEERFLQLPYDKKFPQNESNK